MKKSLLLGFVLSVGFAAFAQNTTTSPNLISTMKNQPMPFSKKNIIGPDEIPPFSSVYAPVSSNLRIENAINPTAFNPVIVGTSGYQLQTNASVRNQLIKNSDGTLCLVWTYSAVTSTWADRGTGYVYNNGSGWSAAPTIRIESVRNGWGNVAVTSTGKEHVITHAPAPNLNVYNNRPVKGTGAWTEVLAPIVTPTPTGNWWPRMCSGGANGNSLHALTVTYPVGNGGTKFAGQDGALCYSRSTDEGVTWSAWSVPTQHDSAAGFAGMNGDSYNIDARGDVIAYTFGDFTTSQTLMKSTDNGVTWTKTTVKAFPVPYYTNQLTDTNGDAVGDTLIVSDGSCDVVIDNSNIAHVFFGRMRVLCTDTSVGLSYFPVTDGLYHWKEGMTSPQIIATVYDTYNNGFLLPTPQTSGDFPFGVYQVSMTSHPSAGVDGNGNIFLTYSSVADSSDNGFGYAYRNAFAIASADGGNTWVGPVYLDAQPFSDQVYTGMAPHFTGTCIPIEYQSDASVGSGFVNQPSGSPDPQSGPADIVYGCLDITDLLNSIQETTNNLFVVSPSYPNPTSGLSTFGITMKHEGKVNVELFNAIGAKVSVIINNENMAAGEHNVNFDATSLSAGVYYYAVTAGGFKVTKKFVKM